MPASKEARIDTAIAAAVLRRDPLGATDRDADGFRKLLEAALQIGRGNRIAGAINDDISGHPLGSSARRANDPCYRVGVFFGVAVGV
jgi:hypothetical protein